MESERNEKSKTGGFFPVENPPEINKLLPFIKTHVLKQGKMTGFPV